MGRLSFQCIQTQNLQSSNGATFGIGLVIGLHSNDMIAHELSPTTPASPARRSIRKRRPGHALFNKHQAEELNKAKKICNAASSHKHRAALQARGITDVFLAGLADDIGFCRQKSSE